MIAVDTSTLIAYFSGDTGRDVNLLDVAFTEKQAVLPPVVLTEIFSSPQIPKHLTNLLSSLPLLPIDDDYWQRAGELRAKLLAKKVKTKLSDTLIAQSCIDHQASLITRDCDFKAFVRFGSLKVLGL